MAYSGAERRQNPRAKGSFMVSYRILEESDNVDISQTKDISLGGMDLTTNRCFNPGTKLAVDIRLPFDPNPIKIVAVVIESRTITENLIYETRLAFLSVDEAHKNSIGKTVDFYLKKGKEK